MLVPIGCRLLDSTLQIKCRVEMIALNGKRVQSLLPRFDEIEPWSISRLKQKTHALVS